MRGNLLKGWAWSVRSHAAALHIVWTLDARFEKGADRQTFAIGRLLKRLMPSPFLAAYNCRRIHVKVPPPHALWNTPCKGHLKKTKKKRKDFWLNAFKPDSVWGFTKNAISRLRRNAVKRATEETSYGTLLPPRVQWVHRLRNKSLNVLFTRAIFYSAVGWPLKAIASRSTT